MVLRILYSTLCCPVVFEIDREATKKFSNNKISGTPHGLITISLESAARV